MGAMLAPARGGRPSPPKPRPAPLPRIAWLTLGLVWQTTEASTKQSLRNVGLPPAALIREHSHAQLVGEFGGGVVPTTVERTSFDAMRQRQVSDDTHPILAQKRRREGEAKRKEERLRALRVERQATPAQSPESTEVRYAANHWLNVQGLLRESVQQQGHADIVMLGDEFTEVLLGNRYGVRVYEENALLTLEMATKLHKRGYSSTFRMQGIPGDTTEQLLDRVEDMGEMDAPPPKVVTLTIGTHDLPKLIKYSSLYPESPTVQQRTEQQIQRIADNVEILVQHCRQWGEQVHTLVFAVLPRTDDLCEKFQKGDQYHNVPVELSQGCPHEVMTWPQSKYYDSIQRLNSLLREVTEAHDRVMFVDCTDHFLDNEFSNAGSLLLRKDVFPDGFNLSSTKGQQVWLDCIYPPLLHTLQKLDPHTEQVGPRRWRTPAVLRVGLWALVMWVWVHFMLGHTQLYQRSHAACMHLSSAHSNLAAVHVRAQLVARWLAFRRVLERKDELHSHPTVGLQP